MTAKAKSTFVCSNVTVVSHGRQLLGFLKEFVCQKKGTELPVDFDKILRALKKTFKTNGVIHRDPEHGVIIQLQGDIRKDVADFFLDATGLITKDQIMIHGS